LSVAIQRLGDRLAPREAKRIRGLLRGSAG
jgi:hypothetical protein